MTVTRIDAIFGWMIDGEEFVKYLHPESVLPWEMNDEEEESWIDFCIETLHTQAEQGSIEFHKTDIGKEGFPDIYAKKIKLEMFILPHDMENGLDVYIGVFFQNIWSKEGPCCHTISLSEKLKRKVGKFQGMLKGTKLEQVLESEPEILFWTDDCHCC